jgi:4-hydroxy-tetrahydrodipicolinate reductase
MNIPLTVVGARGRMGRAIALLAEESFGFRLAAEVDQGDDLEQAVAAGEVVIDFSHHSVTERVAELAVKGGKALVVGTTGHEAGVKERVLQAGRKIPVIMASNFAVGVNVLFHLTRQAAHLLGREFDREIVEIHHRLKKDAPSGTARTLAEILCEVDGLKYAEAARHGREGEPGPRTPDEIGIHALRGGDVIGEHTVYFAGKGERLELTVRSSSRDSYAAGALRAARWLHGKPAGNYSFFDVLGLKET